MWTNDPGDMGGLTHTESVSYRSEYNLFNVANPGFAVGESALFRASAGLCNVTTAGWYERPNVSRLSEPDGFGDISENALLQNVSTVILSLQCRLYLYCKFHLCIFTVTP